MPGDDPDGSGVFCCVVGGGPDDQLAALRWFASLTSIAGVPAEDLVLFTVGVGQSDVLDYLRAQGAIVRPSSAQSLPPDCDRIAGALSLAATQVRGLAVLTAADVVVIEDPRAIVIPPGSVAVAKGHGLSAPARVPADLLAAARLALPVSAAANGRPPDVVSLREDDLSLVLIPGDLLPEVASAWSKFALLLTEQASAARSWPPFIPAIALTMALAQAQIEIHELNARWNASTEASDPAGSPGGAPAVLRYGDRVDRKGFLRPASAAGIDQRVRQVNAALYRLWQEAFPSATFWEWRYQEDPELGSGVGSRGQALREKRELLTAVIGLLRPASVLDVGCGDGEATRDIPIPRYTGIDLSATAVERARQGRPDGDFRVGSLPDNYISAELTLCLDVLIHQSDPKTYTELVSTLCSGPGAVLLSGLQRPPARTTAMVHFHEPLSATIRRLVPEARIYPMRRATGITTLLVLKPAPPRQPSSAQSRAGPPQTSQRRHQLPLRLRLGLWRLQLQFAALRAKRVLRF